MFKPNYIEAGFKTKEKAIIHILEEIEGSPGCADRDGICGITFGNSFIAIKPRKKKNNNE